MALGDPEISPLEIWRGRVYRAIYVFFLTAAYFTLFALVLVPNRELGYAISPLVALLYWRLISLWTTGEQFSPTMNIRPSSTQELFWLIFTVLWAINVLVFEYHLITWYRPEAAP